MNTKEVSTLLDLPIDTIRYYEKEGAIPPVKRDKNNYRVYGRQDLNWLFLVKSLRGAGLSIQSIIEFSKCAQAPTDQSEQQKLILTQQLEEVNDKIHKITSAKELLEYKIETFDEHLAQFKSGELNETNVEALWEVKRFK